MCAQIPPIDSDILRIHRFLPFSLANGPGVRTVIWVQGCSLKCPYCYNPETHPFTDGEYVSVENLFRRVAALKDTIEGITVSGGEPLQQQQPLLALLSQVRHETPFSVLLFTGYTWEEVQQMPVAHALLACVDVLVAGRYNASQHIARDLHGSANKTTHLITPRYTMDDLRSVPSTEIIVTKTGEVVMSGIDPIKW